MPRRAWRGREHRTSGAWAGCTAGRQGRGSAPAQPSGSSECRGDRSDHRRGGTLPRSRAVARRTAPAPRPARHHRPAATNRLPSHPQPRNRERQATRRDRPADRIPPDPPTRAALPPRAMPPRRGGNPSSTPPGAGSSSGRERRIGSTRAPPPAAGHAARTRSTSVRTPTIPSTTPTERRSGPARTERGRHRGSRLARGAPKRYPKPQPAHRRNEVSSRGRDHRAEPRDRPGPRAAEEPKTREDPRLPEPGVPEHRPPRSPGRRTAR